ncbi:MAG: hypothetical protein LBE92_04685 [Chryseobacterium sp.]|uniref:hypothetical protein n=1 Tax=Chryseobacterium sp. TaxID=1871047 RepID=UPI00282D0A4F|nr:hypothetical protein [Chryseobacterium sp.]MDR2235398.1 hypothetical protein [Chryseobacterium sp.]
MKFHQLIILIPLLVSNVNCTSQQKTAGTEKTDTLQRKSEISKIEVTEQTRGTNRIITFVSGTQTTSLNGNVTTSVLKDEDWKNMVKQAGMIDLSAIESFQAPTDGRATDRALASAIIITTKDGTYRSSSFDAGRPPKELEGLYRLLVDRKISKSVPREREFR